MGSLIFQACIYSNIVHMYFYISYIYIIIEIMLQAMIIIMIVETIIKTIIKINNNNNNKYACNFTYYIYVCVCVVCVHYVHISKPYPLWCIASHARGPRWWSCPSKSSRKSAWRIFVALATSGNLSQRLFLLQPLYIMTTILTILKKEATIMITTQLHMGGPTKSQQ